MKTHVLVLLAAMLTVSCGQCKESEVFVETGSVAVLPCEEYSLRAHSSAVHWKKAAGNEMKTVWRRDRSGLEFRSIGKTAPRAYCPQPNFGNGDFSLHIDGVREEDGGLYHCIVDESRVIKKVMLRVIKLTFAPAEVVEGYGLKLTCSITPKLDRAVTKWQVNGLERKSTYAQELTIYKVSQKESGNWSCLVHHKNVEGKASASVQVQGIVVPKDDYEAVYAEVGSSVTLPCIFSDGLVLSDVSWNKEPDASHLPVSLPSSLKTTSSPAVEQWDRSSSIESVENVDQGIYKCSGEVMKTTKKRVERYIKLVTARVLSTFSSSSGRMILTCDLSNTSRVTHYVWLRLDHGKNTNQTMTLVQNSTSKVLNIPRAQENMMDGWMCRFYENQRLLGSVTFYQEMMSGLKGQSKTESSKKLFMAIGLGFLLMLALLILFQMHKNHRRRKMIMQYPAMETIVHLAANERERKERCKAREKEQPKYSEDL